MYAFCMATVRSRAMPSSAHGSTGPTPPMPVREAGASPELSRQATPHFILMVSRTICMQENVSRSICDKARANTAPKSSRCSCVAGLCSRAGKRCNAAREDKHINGSECCCGSIPCRMQLTCLASPKPHQVLCRSLTLRTRVPSLLASHLAQLAHIPCLTQLNKRNMHVQAAPT